MKIIHTAVLLVVAFHAPQVPVSSAMKLESLFNFQENNYYETSPSSSSFIKAVSGGHQGESHDTDSSDASQTDATVAQGGSGAGKGKGGGKTKHNGYDDDNKCCTCTCYDNNDYSGDSRSYERGYDSGSIGGEDYCLCNCFCGSKAAMPIIPTIEPSTPPPSPTIPSLCEIPQPLVPDPFDSIIDLDTCPGSGELAVSNTLIRLQNDISCSNIETFYFQIMGDNNTFDCGGFSVTDSNNVDAFQFSGRNSVLQNCPNISGFRGAAIRVVEESSLYIFNVSASGNAGGSLSVVEAEAFVDASNFSGNGRGMSSSSESGLFPFKLVVVNSVITNIQRSQAILLQGLGESCLKGNDLSGNIVNVVIEENANGFPSVTLANNNACNSTSGVDIADNSAPGNTALFGTTCSFVYEMQDGSGFLNATDYGCEPCPP